MTPTTLAAALMRDVPRYDTDPKDRRDFVATPDGGWLNLDAVLAALTTALDGVDERAGEVVGNLRNPRCKPNPHTTADLITALLAQNAALRAERDEALEWLSASQGYIADAVFALDKQEKAEAKLAAMEAIATQWKARAERLEAALHRIQEGRYGRAAAIARTALTTEADNDRQA